MTLYGIPNCDTVKKARTWLQNHQIEYSFYDLKKQGINKELAQEFLSNLKLEAIINKKGTTWKSIKESYPEELQEADILEIIISHPTVLKRPIIEWKKKFIQGFNEEEYMIFFR